MATNTMLQTTITDSILWITLHRPQARNAFNDEMIQELTDICDRYSTDDAVRAMVLTGSGDVFCAGGDFSWMQKMVSYTYEENITDARALAHCLEKLDQFPKPTVARINGSAMGGGVGLLATCDIVITVDKAQFGFPEVILGLVPATIAPYILRRIGYAACRHLFLTAERFSAQTALQYGLVSAIVPVESLDQKIAEILGYLRKGGAKAQMTCKQLLRQCITLPPDQLLTHTAELIAQLRVSEEGQEGLQAALGKRRPRWQEG